MGAVGFACKFGLNAATPLQLYGKPLESFEIKPKRSRLVFSVIEALAKSQRNHFNPFKNLSSQFTHATCFAKKLLSS